MTETKSRKCEQCKERPGTVRIDPHQEELDGVKVKMRLCDQCYQSRIDEI